MANALTRVANKLIGIFKGEGDYRPGPYWLPATGGWLSSEAGSNWNWWQMGYDVQGGYTRSAMVEACVSAYAQTVAMCPGDHWVSTGNGGRERVTTSALTRILRTPNDYQSISDFLLNVTRSLYLDGNAYALAIRNNRFEIQELHLFNPRQCDAQIAVDGSIFYHLGGNQIIESRIASVTGSPMGWIPARDVLHIKFQTSKFNPLKGESPLVAAAMDIAAGDAIAAQQIAFYVNQARPSTVLTTDLTLDKATVQELRDRWNEQSKGLNSGGTPILTSGIKPMQLAVAPRDAQLAEIIEASGNHIALAMRVPLAILGIGANTYGSTESLMQFWKSSGLGFCLNHIEEAFGQMFGLKGQPEEYLEFNTNALLRSSFKERVEALQTTVLGGIMAPNEARAEIELPAVEDGDDVRVQQQVVPLSYGAELQPPPSPAPAAAAPPAEKSVPQRISFNADNAADLRRKFRQRASRHATAV